VDLVYPQELHDTHQDFPMAGRCNLLYCVLAETIFIACQQHATSLRQTHTHTYTNRLADKKLAAKEN